MRKLIVALVISSLVLALALFIPLKERLSRIQATQKASEPVKDRLTGAAKQFNYLFWSRAYPEPHYLNDKYLAAWEQAEAIRKGNMARGNEMQSGMWNPVGPNNSPGGRILTIAIDPSNSNNVWAGSASGGMWKSTNGATSWTRVVTNLPVLGVTSILIHPTTSSIMYAATGEVYRVDSTGTTPNPGNTTYSVWKTRGTYGIGILKSLDGGVTWNRLWNRSTDELFGIQELKFDPVNPDILYACTTQGLWRSTDAGNSWTNILNATYVSDVVINGTTIVAGVGNLGNTLKGIYRSTNNGVNWTKITAGLPATQSGYIKFGWVASDPSTIVASIGVSTASTVDLYRSTNTGLTWSGLSGSDHTAYQYWFSHDVAINPSNTNRMLMMGVSIGQYTLPSTPGSVGGGIHADVHDIKYDPSNAAICYVACDGGVWKSTNAGSATPSFAERNNGLSATQFYASLGVSRTDPYLYLGGLQDNGNWLYNGSSWSKISWQGGDGAACAIDPSNDFNMIACKDARGGARSTNRGASGSITASSWASVGDSRTGFVAPLAQSKSNPSIVYLASDNLHRSINGGGSFTGGGGVGTAPISPTNYIEAYRKTALAMEVSPTNPNKVYVSTSSFSQYDNDVDNIYYTGTPNVLKTTTGGTPFTSIMGSGGTALPNRYILDFAISETYDDSVFVVVGGFGTPHVYVTGNGGTSWTPMSAGLPDVPFNSILIDPVNPKIIYAGGDLGVYVSPNRGISWLDFNNGMWDATQVFDLQYTADYQLLAATHGKGIFRGARYSPTLPVSILSFTGEAEQFSNNIHWEVSGEVNVSGYHLERSHNGISFQNIAVIPASNATGYNYNDALINQQSYFYRLKSVDLDGSYKYSSVIHIARNAGSGLKIMGNPFSNQIQLSLNVSETGEGKLNLYDAIGKRVRSEKINLTTGQNNFTIKNLNALPGGTYVIEAVCNGQRWKQRVLKN